MWRVLKVFVKKDDDPDINIIKDGDLTLTKPSEIAKAFNDYFTGIIPQLLRKKGLDDAQYFHDCQNCICFTLCICNYPDGQFDLLHTSDHEVSTHLKVSKPSSYDYHYIPKIVLLTYPLYFSNILSHFINLSIDDSSVPKVLKCAKIIPKFKNGSPKDLSNYRPISNLSIISKIFERVVYKQLTSYIMSNDLLHPNQFGYRQNSSTESAFLFLNSLITTAINDNFKVCVVFLDYSKAFDTISHKILCTKLFTQFNFSHKTVRLIWSYLSDREQFTHVNGHASSITSNSHGVPQGSILGPLLFNLYINDIHESKIYDDTNGAMFADDNSTFTISLNKRELQNKTQKELDAIHIYNIKNKLILNADKTKAMLFNCSSNDDFDININNQKIEIVDSFTYLGYTIDNKLKYKQQIQTIVGKLKSSNYILARTAYFLPKTALLKIYHSIAYPHIIYNKFIFLTLSQNQLKSLQQKLYLSQAIINDTNISQSKFNINHIVQYYCYIAIFKIINDPTNGLLKNLLIKSKSTHNTRNINNLFVQFSRNNLCKRGFTFHIPTFWNRLPSDIKNIHNLGSFKTMVYKYLSES